MFLEISQQVMADLLSKKPTGSTVPELRKFANDFFIAHSGKLEDVENITNFSIQNGDYELPLRLYRINQFSRVCLFIHGGGWIQGNLETHDYLCRKIAKICDINVLAVDYRLAPENMFPTPLDDISCAYEWCKENYSEIYLSGDSAGGNLSAALCIKESQKQGRIPDGMFLFYPVLGNNLETESYKAYESFPTLSKFGVAFFLFQYIGKPTSVDKLMFPLLEDDMTVFPRTFLVSAECDVLLSEQCEFKDKMVNAGRDCRQEIVNGAIHGFMTYGREFDEHNTNVLKKVSDWLNTPLS